MPRGDERDYEQELRLRRRWIAVRDDVSVQRMREIGDPGWDQGGGVLRRENQWDEGDADDAGRRARGQARRPDLRRRE